MSKNSRKFRAYDDDEDYNYDQRGYHEELQKRRKEKRWRNAIRSKNIADLVDEYDED